MCMLHETFVANFILNCSPISTSECACLPAHLFFCCLPTTILCSLIILRGKGEVEGRGRVVKVGLLHMLQHVSIATCSNLIYDVLRTSLLVHDAYFLGFLFFFFFFWANSPCYLGLKHEVLDISICAPTSLGFEVQSLSSSLSSCQSYESNMTYFMKVFVLTQQEFMKNHLGYFTSWRYNNANCANDVDFNGIFFSILLPSYIFIPCY